ncbi:signal peptidase II [Petrotoga halophila]|uniref:signal peptidase II n=1 Tax=Petrotoga halophila TaxID=301141 RepID=UPI000CDEAA5F|nr:signal peptidase II [Petrotoga halophila]
MNWVIPIIIFFDQLTKKLSETFLLENTIKIGFFQLTYVENTGIAFGLFKGMALFHGVFSTLIVIFLFILKEKYKEKYKFFTTSFDLGITFIIGGALGNIFDRIRLGYVVDMIYWPYFSIFNVADIFVTFGGVILLYHFFKRSSHGKKNVQS